MQARINESTIRGRASRRLIGRISPLVLAVVVGATAFAGAAAAAVPNAEQHRSTSANNSLNKSTSAACPAGRTLTGVGGDVNGSASNGRVVIDDLSPNAGRTQALTTGFEVLPTGFNWFLRSYAICASPLAGAELVSASSPFDSVDGKAVTASCPVGKQLTGAGGEVTGGVGKVVMDDVRPNGNPATSATVTGFEVDPIAGNWSVTAHAICADPLAGAQRVVVNSPFTSTNKGVLASCPAGKKLIGLGGEISGAAGEVVVDDYTPNELLTSAIVRGAEAVDADGAFAGNWRVTAYALCATP